jgi:hypothetical protein
MTRAVALFRSCAFEGARHRGRFALIDPLHASAAYFHRI